MADYEATPDHWVRRLARRKNVAYPASIEIATILEKHTVLEDEQLEFLERHARSDWTNLCAGLPQFRTEFAGVLALIRDAESAEARWRAFQFLSHAVTFVGQEFLRPAVRQLLPCFFRMYPTGKVVVIRYDTRVDLAAGMLRFMYAAAQAPLQELVKDGSSHGVATLREWHMTSLSHLMPALLDFFSYLFYPFVGGARAILPGLAFYFLLDPPEKHMPGPFPRNWLAFASNSATFADEAVDGIKLATEPKGPTAHRAGHQRFCHDTGFGAEDRLCLLRWYLGCLNRLFFELTDAANFTANLDREGVIDPVFWI